MIVRLITDTYESQGVTKHTFLQDSKHKAEKEEHGHGHREVAHRKQDLGRALKG